LIAFSAQGQEPIAEYESDFVFKTYWQEHLPDAYQINDSTVLLAGLNVNMVTKSVNFFTRKISTSGIPIGENEIFNFPNPNGYSYLLSSYFQGSVLDQGFLYLLSVSDFDSCWSQGEMFRAYRLVKILVADGTVVKDTVMCLDGIRVFERISTTASKDSLYIYGFLGYVNEKPKTMLWKLTKNLKGFTEDTIESIETTLIPFRGNTDFRMVAGSHYPYEDGLNRNLRDIWYGHLSGTSVMETNKMDYFEDHILFKPIQLDTNETAFIAYNTGFFFDESAVHVFRQDTIAWNFYDVFSQEIADIIKVGDQYLVVQSSYREDDDRKDKIILHSIDHDGFPFAQIERIVPWIQYTLGGLKMKDYYFVFVQIRNRDVLEEVVQGTLPVEEAQYEYTHVFKFRIND